MTYFVWASRREDGDGEGSVSDGLYDRESLVSRCVSRFVMTTNSVKHLYVGR